MSMQAATRAPSPNTTGMAAQSTRLDRLSTILDAIHPDLPSFTFGWQGLTSPAHVRIMGAPTGSGDSRIRVPWRSSLADWQGFKPWTASLAGDWLINMSVDTIDTTTSIGGRVDQQPPQPNSNYLIYAFMYPPPDGPSFGIGVALQPVLTYSAATTLGSTITLTLAGTGLNRGWRIPVNGRVIIRRGATPADAANQGTVLSRTNTSLTIALDASTFYGAAIPNLPGTVIQTAAFAPQLSDQDSRYPGAGTEYAFRVLGRLTTEAATPTSVLRVRYINQPWILPTFSTIATGAGPLAAVQVPLIRWIPVESTEALIRMTRLASGVAGGAAAGNDITNFGWQDSILATPPMGQVARDNFWVPVRGRDCSVSLVSSSPGTFTFDVMAYRLSDNLSG